MDVVQRNPSILLAQGSSFPTRHLLGNVSTSWDPTPSTHTVATYYSANSLDQQ